MRPRPAASRRHLPSSPFSAPAQPVPVEVYEVGERITHDRYGLGRVVAVESLEAVVVEFSSGVRRLAASDRKLSKL